MLCDGGTQGHVFLGFPGSLLKAATDMVDPSFAAIFICPEWELLSYAAPIRWTTQFRCHGQIAVSAI